MRVRRNFADSLADVGGGDAATGGGAAGAVAGGLDETANQLVSSCQDLQA